MRTSDTTSPPTVAAVTDQPLSSTDIHVRATAVWVRTSLLDEAVAVLNEGKSANKMNGGERGGNGKCGGTRRSAGLTTTWSVRTDVTTERRGAGSGAGRAFTALSRSKSSTFAAPRSSTGPQRSRSLRGFDGVGNLARDGGDRGGDWGWVRAWLFPPDQSPTSSSSSSSDEDEDGDDFSSHAEILVQDGKHCPRRHRHHGRRIRVGPSLLRMRTDCVYGEEELSDDAFIEGGEANVLVANPSELASRRGGGEEALRFLSGNSTGKKLPGSGGKILPPHDLIDLTHLHEPAVVHSLQERYERDVIYTATGPILLAVNPFKTCGPGVYSVHVMDEYSRRGEEEHVEWASCGTAGRSKSSHPRDRGGEKEGKDDDDAEEQDALLALPPHVYKTADRAYRLMLRGMTRKPWEDDDYDSDGGGQHLAVDQSILVSGESGAGKTMTTRFVMDYLASLSRRRGRRVDRPDHTPHDEAAGPPQKSMASLKKHDELAIEEEVLQSNPILESFGNARTIRNDNSSRFGKFIELQFETTTPSSDDVHLVGASIEHYLLEKVRLLDRKAAGERNYHIFYEILAGADDVDRGRWSLEGRTLDDFVMTRGTVPDRRDGVQDADMYHELRRAMNTIGLKPGEQQDIFCSTCALLHLSNVTFVTSTDGGAHDDEGSTIEQTPDDPSFSAALALLGLTAKETQSKLCTRTIRAGFPGSREGQTLVTNISPDRARLGLEALIKAAYAEIFSFLVQRINELMSARQGRGGAFTAGFPPDARAPAGGGSAAVIGLLDIFGFESFPKNSFEQLCINYCNEALQQQFNMFVFKNEQYEYEREGIQWSFIGFPDNQDVLDLIDGKGCGILSILDDQCKVPGTNDKSFAGDIYKKCATSSRFAVSGRQMIDSLFEIRHFAGYVEYDSDGFVSKNKDELPKEATDLLLSSSEPFVRTIGEMISAKANEAAATGRTVGSQFVAQLARLRRRIDSTCPHYVRCLKPNDELMPNNFNPVMIAHQLKCSGVLEAVRVSRVGYPHRFTHQLFVKRYHMLLTEKGDEAGLTEHELRMACRCLIDVAKQQQQPSESKETDEDWESCDLLSIGIQVGRTKVFLRGEAFRLLENARSQNLLTSITKLQATARRRIAQMRYQRALRMVLVLQCSIRQHVARMKVRSMYRHNASTLIQRGWRKAVNHYKFRMAVQTAIWTQRMYRGLAVRSRNHQLCIYANATRIASWWRYSQHYHRFRSLRKAAITLQFFFRGKSAQERLRNLAQTAKDAEVASSARCNSDLMPDISANQGEQGKSSSQQGADQVVSAVAAINSELLRQMEQLRREAKLNTDAVEAAKAELSRQMEQLRREATKNVHEIAAAKTAAQSELEKYKRETELLRAQLDSSKQMVEPDQFFDAMSPEEMEIEKAFDPTNPPAFAHRNVLTAFQQDELTDFVSFPQGTFAEKGSEAGEKEKIDLSSAVAKLKNNVHCKQSMESQTVFRTTQLDSMQSNISQIIVEQNQGWSSFEDDSCNESFSWDSEDEISFNAVRQTESGKRRADQSPNQTSKPRPTGPRWGSGLSPRTRNLKFSIMKKRTQEISQYAPIHRAYPSK